VVERLRFFLLDAIICQDYFIRKPFSATVFSQVLVEALLRFSPSSSTTDEAVVIAAAKKLSDKLVVSDDNKAIGR
jgi:hypothetical protein